MTTLAMNCGDNNNNDNDNDDKYDVYHFKNSESPKKLPV